MDESEFRTGLITLVDAVVSVTGDPSGELVDFRDKLSDHDDDQGDDGEDGSTDDDQDVTAQPGSPTAKAEAAVKAEAAAKGKGSPARPGR
jgi:hypothetical protein